MIKKVVPKTKEEGEKGAKKAPVKQAQIEAAKAKAKEMRMARKATQAKAPAAAKHAGKGR